MLPLLPWIPTLTSMGTPQILLPNSLPPPIPCWNVCCHQVLPPTPNWTTSKPTTLAPPIQRKPPKWPLHANLDSPHKDTSTTTIAQAPQLMLLPRAPLTIQKPLLPRRIGDLVSNFYSWNFYFFFGLVWNYRFVWFLCGCLVCSFLRFLGLKRVGGGLRRRRRLFSLREKKKMDKWCHVNNFYQISCPFSSSLNRFGCRDDNEMMLKIGRQYCRNWIMGIK